MISKAIRAINPNAVFIVGRESLDEITWLEGTKPIEKSKIEKKVKELQAEYDSKQYQRDRAINYPSIQEQLDMQYWDRKNGTKTWEESIDKVKADNPKPE